MKNLFGDLALDTSVQEVKTAIEAQTPVDVSALATSAKQLPDGHEVEVNNFPALYPLPSSQVTTLTPPAAITGFATSAKQLANNHDVKVTNFPATQAVSATSLPLPAGAATSAKQLADNHNVKVTAMPTVAVTGNFFQGTQPVSVTTLPLPTGAATSAKQLADNHNVTVSNIASVPLVDVSNLGTEATLLQVRDNIANGSAVTHVTDAGGVMIDFSTADKQLPDNHQVTVSNLGSINTFIKDKPSDTLITGSAGYPTEIVDTYSDRVETSILEWVDGFPHITRTVT